jgi:hypothetical protein
VGKDGRTPNFDQVLFNRRGEIGPGDDPESLIRRLAAGGYHAFLHAADLGDRVRCDKPAFAIEHLAAAPRKSLSPPGRPAAS